MGNKRSAQKEIERREALAGQNERLTEDRKDEGGVGEQEKVEEGM